tara:strand:+ start:1563 stop:1991 length:429 start_codon:yes stop_codon:yes gene_type:complete
MLDKEIRKIKYITEDEANIRAGAIDSKTRKRPIVLARMVLANFLMMEVGLKEETLRRFICRDRTSFYFYRSKHEAYMENPKIYPEYNDLFVRCKLRYYMDEDTLFDGEHKNTKIEKLSEIDDKLGELYRKKIVLEEEINILS